MVKDAVLMGCKVVETKFDPCYPRFDIGRTGEC